jgi:hypothetical protein
MGVICFFDQDTSLQISYREDTVAIFAIIKPSCVFIRKIDIKCFQPAFLRLVNGLFHISTPFFDLPEKQLSQMPYIQRSASGP